MFIQTDASVLDTTFKVFIIFAVYVCPTDFSNGNDTRENHVFTFRLVIHVFCPCVALYTQNEVSFPHLCQCIRHRVIRVGFFQRCITSDGHRLNLRVTLISIQIHAIATRCHDDRMVHGCSCNTAFLTTPRHDGSRRCQSAFQYFIPTDDFLAFGRQILFHTLDYVTLQFLFG